MAKYKEYPIIHYNTRKDGKVEIAGKEKRVMTEEEALELSMTAMVVTGYTFNGNPIFLMQGKHAEFDAHLGWLS